MKRIQSTEGVSFLMENLWLRHKAGLRQSPSNVYMVELPPLTEKELAAAQRGAEEHSRPDYESEELSGALI